ncbi:MAG: SRPBCC family protein [Nocardioides sp.]
MSSFEMSRSTTIDAPPDRIHALLDDFHAWREWSPWEEVDPDLHRTFTGPDQGVGAHYAWRGNSKAGQGTMEIIESSPSSVVVDLRFLKPIKATNVTRFDLTPAGAGTTVVWTMTGDRGAVMGLMGKLYFDRAVGKDFDRGLAQLKSAAEANRPQHS